MKQLQFIFILLALSLIAKAQDTLIDKQKMEAGRAKPDSNYVNYLTDKGLKYESDENKIDSAGILLTVALDAAYKINYIHGILELQRELGGYYFDKGKLVESLDFLLKNEGTAIAADDSESLFKTLRPVADIYMRSGDLNMARQALDRRQYILDNNGIKGLKDTSYYVLSQYNSLAHYYTQVHRPDSVEYFYRKMYTVGKNTSSSNLFIQLGAGGLGRLFGANGKYDSAVHYYKISSEAALKGNLINYYHIIIPLADAYFRSGKKDSAYYYAYKAYYGSAKLGYLLNLISGSNQLANFFSKEHNYDSAYKYMNISAKFKDGLSSMEELKGIRSLTSQMELEKLQKKSEKEQAIQEYKTTLRAWFLAGGLLLLLAIIVFMYRVSKQRAKRKKEIEVAYNNLKSTQKQLVQSEKMASLGELTAGIAHEIQNPLNFVNNFSDVNKELLAEMKAEMDKGNIDDAKEIANDVIENSEKINHHGKRAGDIVKGMLQHSRTSTGVKEPTDINALADEYLRLSYHGLRAKDKTFNAKMETDFDETIGKINVIPQDIGRVLLNLYNNAFYAVNQQKNKNLISYAKEVTPFEKVSPLNQPTVSVTTKKSENHVLITVSDNGNGIPQKIVDKIFQPFFTTKPTGQGTGLGLSLSYDILKAHGGEIKVETKEGEESTFIIQLPVV